MKLQSYKQVKDTDKFEKFAKEAGCTIDKDHGKGSHRTVIAPNGDQMTYPHNKDLAPGLAIKLFKWLLTIGVILILLYAFANYA